MDLTMAAEVSTIAGELVALVTALGAGGYVIRQKARGRAAEAAPPDARQPPPPAPEPTPPPSPDPVPASEPLVVADRPVAPAWPANADAFLKRFRQLIDRYAPKVGARLTWSEDDYPEDGPVRGEWQLPLKHRTYVAVWLCDQADNDDGDPERVEIDVGLYSDNTTGNVHFEGLVAELLDGQDGGELLLADDWRFRRATWRDFGFEAFHVLRKDELSSDHARAAVKCFVQLFNRLEDT